MSILTGEIINGRYRIIKQLGEGGFGAVYRAEDLSLKTICALKVNMDYWDEAQRQFENEALMLAGLRHPNLPRVTDYFTIFGQGQYLVMDFVEGYDLQTILERVGQPLVESQTLKWIDQICDALAYLHAQFPPIIHRDIKPANIKITPSGLATLVDFGIAKRFDPTLKTKVGARAVTAGYSPVEQYGNETTDCRTDIYALGATLYTLLTRKLPPESIARVTGTPMVSPRQYNPKISPHVERAILHAMAVLADDRFNSVKEFREALSKPDKPLSTRTVPPMPEIEERYENNLSERTTSGELIKGVHSRGGITTHTSAPPSHRSAVQMEWQTILEGEFLFGDEPLEIQLPAFLIAKYPVTNQQYRYFLDGNPKYPPPEYWKGRNYPSGKQRHPVVGVSYYDAVAFCKWLGCRLPTEHEWEKAARGADGKEYPWGDDWEDGKFCNNWDARIGGTTPVDRYPLGNSTYDVWDLTGNTWEWTSTDYQGPYMHILKGGSWRLFSRFAVRAVQRDWLTLDDKRDDVGFRCAKDV